MKKRFFFLALVAVASISPPASEITIRCCDNSVHRFYAVSPEAFQQSGATEKEVQKYMMALPKMLVDNQVVILVSDFLTSKTFTPSVESKIAHSACEENSQALCVSFNANISNKNSLCLSKKLFFLLHAFPIFSGVKALY